MLERERSYSTAYGEVAVPHAFYMNALRTGMYICINAKPVQWGENRVRIMLLFAVNKDDRTRFYEVFENLIVLLLEPSNAHKVAQSRTYNEFIVNITDCF